jgi:hypothetical protein
VTKGTIVFKDDPKRPKNLSKYLGILLICITMLFVFFIIPAMGSSVSFWQVVLEQIISTIIFIGWAVYEFHKASLRSTPREIIIDDSGIRYINNNMVQWNVAWDQVVGLISESGLNNGWRYTGFKIFLKSGHVVVDSFEDFSPINNARKVFQEIVKRIVSPKIFIKDTLGWAAMVDLRGRLQQPPRPKSSDSLVGQWHETLIPNPQIRRNVIASMTAIIVGIVLLILMISSFYSTLTTEYHDTPAPWMYLGIAIPELIVIALGILVYFYGNRSYPVAIFFDEERLVLQLTSKKLWKGKWSDIKEVRMNSKDRMLMIRSKSDPFWEIGPLPLNVVNAVYETYWSARMKDGKKKIEFMDPEILILNGRRDRSV